MNGGICSRETSRPLTRPGTNAIAAPDRIAASIATKGGRPSVAVKKFEACAAITDDRPMTNPSERSMPEEMMTKVWPSASRRGAVANTRIDWML